MTYISISVPLLMLSIIFALISLACREGPEAKRPGDLRAPPTGAVIPDLSEGDEICPDLPRIQSAFAQDYLQRIRDEIERSCAPPWRVPETACRRRLWVARSA